MSHYYEIATDADAMREYGANAGRESQEDAWILTPYDVWVANPYYTGPSVPHPEADIQYEEEDVYDIDPCFGLGVRYSYKD